MKIASESRHISNAREIVSERLANLDKQVTPEALARKVSQIKDGLVLHPRIPVKKHSMGPFDENQSSVEETQRVKRIRELFEKI